MDLTFFTFLFMMVDHGPTTAGAAAAAAGAAGASFISGTALFVAIYFLRRHKLKKKH